jgi:hypothetical protein
MSELIEQATYLQDEAQALAYVIDDIPYDEQAAGGRSIRDWLILIDANQMQRFKPLTDAVTKGSNKPLNLKELSEEQLVDRYDAEDKVLPIHELLQKIAKHRGSILAGLERMSGYDLDRDVSVRGGKQQQLLTCIEQLIEQEREMLKQIASIVKDLQTESDRNRSLKSGE